MPVLGGEKQLNLERAGTRIKEAVDEGAQIVLLPEAMNLGWSYPCTIDDADGIPGSDTFRYSRTALPDVREWGTINVTVDDETYDAVLPSSLFGYVHGVADPYYKATIRDP